MMLSIHNLLKEVTDYLSTLPAEDVAAIRESFLRNCARTAGPPNIGTAEALRMIRAERDRRAN